MSSALRRIARALVADRPRGWDLLVRLPWWVGIVCSGYLLCGEGKMRCTCGLSSRVSAYWIEGAYRESYIAASLLLYSTVLCVLTLLVWRFRGGRLVAALFLLGLFLVVLSMFDYCFLDKVKGHVIWPMDR